MLRTLRLSFGDRDPATVRVVDLGCLEGGHTAEFARAGYRTLGIEGREANFERCQYVQDRLGLANLEFVFDDVRNVERYGTFDATVCCGLLYHLDSPVAFLRSLARITERVLILQTHYAPEDDVAVPWALSPFTVNEGHRGRWFVEWPDGTPPNDQDAWASVGNSRSFWLAKPDLLQATLDAGFPRSVRAVRLPRPPDRRHLYRDQLAEHVRRGEGVAPVAVSVSRCRA